MVVARTCRFRRSWPSPGRCRARQTGSPGSPTLLLVQGRFAGHLHACDLPRRRVLAAARPAATRRSARCGRRSNHWRSRRLPQGLQRQARAGRALGRRRRGDSASASRKCWPTLESPRLRSRVSRASTRRWCTTSVTSGEPTSSFGNSRQSCAVSDARPRGFSGSGAIHRGERLFSRYLRWPVAADCGLPRPAAMGSVMCR